MNIDLTLEQLQEMNQILGLLKSQDLESRLVGFEMFRMSDLFRHQFYDFKYKSKPGKCIPVSWYIYKASELAEKAVANQDQYVERFENLIIPIVESILLSEPKFQVDITFNINKQKLMEHYNIRSLEDRCQQT